MLRQIFCGDSWIVLVMLLAGGILGPDARAQFRSAESSSAPDTMRSLAPAPLTENASLDGYVREADGLGTVRDASVRYDPTLSRGQELLLGTVGLVVQAFCDTDELKPLTVRPDFVLEPGERACIHCDRMEDRAWDAVWGRQIASAP